LSKDLDLIENFKKYTGKSMLRNKKKIKIPHISKIQ